MPVAGLGASRAAGLKLAVWRQSSVAVPERSPSSHDPAPPGPRPGYSSNEAAFDLTWRLALGGAAGDVGACFGVAGHARQHDGGQRLVELSVTGAVEAVTDDLARRRFDRAAPPSMAKAASERSRPACDQAVSSCEAQITPSPGSVSSRG